MKKQLLGGIILFVIITITSFNLNIVTENTFVSDITLSNIEALAQTSGEDVVITCGASYGRCWRTKPYSGWGASDQCEFSGYQRDFCCC